MPFAKVAKVFAEELSQQKSGSSIAQDLRADLARVTAELQNCNDLCSNEDGGGTVSTVLERKISRLEQLWTEWQNRANENETALAAAQKRIERLEAALTHLCERSVDRKPCFCSENEQWYKNGGEHTDYCKEAREALNG